MEWASLAMYTFSDEASTDDLNHRSQLPNQKLEKEEGVFFPNGTITMPAKRKK
jgi:hypothetical protein